MTGQPRPIDGLPAYAIALVIGASYACLLFGGNILLNHHGYWAVPVAPGAGIIDVRTAVSGYYWIMQDAWRWPLLWLPLADFPSGVSGVKLDPIPLLALLAKTIRSLTGLTPNLMPLWLVGAFSLNSVALTALVRELGGRNWIAAVTAAGIGAMMPIVHHRFGHLGLMAHWVPVLALALYARVAGRMRLSAADGPCIIGLCLLAASIHLYLFVMTAAIAAAIVLQAVISRWAGIGMCLVGLFLIVAAGVGTVWAFGALDDPGMLTAASGFGYNSMNLMSPFWPQTSGLFAGTGIYWLTRGSIGATSGQYEGYAYCGFGALVLILLAIALRWRDIVPLVRRNVALVAAMLALTLWAVSNQIYFGPYLVLSFPVPDVLADTVLGWFRSSGRFFWPVAWLLIGLGIAGVLTTLHPRHAMAVAAICLGLQWVDLSLWRKNLAASGTQTTSVFGNADEAQEVFKEVFARRRLTVVPSINCVVDAWKDYSSPANVAILEMQLMAARANAAWRRPAGARMTSDCPTERQTSLLDLAEAGVLISLDQADGSARHAEAEASFACRRFSLGLICLPR